MKQRLGISSLCLSLSSMLWTCPKESQAQALQKNARADRTQGERIELRSFLERVLEHHPKLAVAKAKARATQAKVRGSKGAFDPKLGVDANLQPVGRYQNGTLGLKVGWLSPFRGLGAFVDYRLGRGKFPVYQGDRKTTTLGRAKLGVKLPLLAGGKIDQARATLQASRYRNQQQRCENDQVRLDLLEQAASIYWKWVAQALEVEIRQSLLTVAKARDAALQARLESGAIAGIVLLDNQRLIIERESKLIAAQSKLAQSNIKMSLYWRDTAGEPLLVQASQVPERFGANDSHSPRSPNAAAPTKQEIDQALTRLPELCQLSQEISDARVAVQLAKNQRLPELDLQGYASRYFGGEIDFPPTDVGVGVEFRISLGMRKVTGRWRAAQAKLDGLLHEQRRLRDSKRALVQQAQVEVDAAYGLLKIADRRVALSEKMAAAERLKFEQGASDLVVVNLREQALANAQRDRVLAWAKFEQARIAEFRSLGLDPLGRDVP